MGSVGSHGEGVEICVGGCGEAMEAVAILSRGQWRQFRGCGWLC